MKFKNPRKKCAIDADFVKQNEINFMHSVFFWAIQLQVHLRCHVQFGCNSTIDFIDNGLKSNVKLKDQRYAMNALDMISAYALNNELDLNNAEVLIRFDRTFFHTIRMKICRFVLAHLALALRLLHGWMFQPTELKPHTFMHSRMNFCLDESGECARACTDRTDTVLNGN